ncbi:MAG: tetratricopeptide repeat protein, partial [Proteobacteria bacterium]|nr:tetratricopeptide repeat protein [Pseudomonadota bacterium]
KLLPSGLMLKQVRNDLALDKIEQADKTLASLNEAANIPEADKLEAVQLSLGTKTSLGDWNTEQKTLMDYLQNHLNSESDVRAVAQVCRWLNKISDCRVAFQILLEKNQDSFPLRSELIRMSLEEMDAAAIFNPAMPLSKLPLVQIDQLIEEGIKLSPESEELWGAKAVSAFAAREYETMENAVDEVERGEQKVWVGAFLRQLKAYANGDEAQQDAARSALKGYIKDVSDPDMAVSLIYALKAVNEDESALQVLDAMAKYHPDNTTVMNAYLRHAIDAKDQRRAESILKRLEKRGALTSEHEFIYAHLVEQLGDINGALERMIVLSEKNDGNMPQYLAYIGELFMKQSKCDSALPKFTQALELNPTDPETHFNKGFCLYQDKQFDPALVEFNEAATQDDTNRKYDLWIGRVMKELKMNADAQRAFTTVIEDYTQKPEESRTEEDRKLAAQAYFYRAETHKFQNRRTESRLDFVEALDMEPENLQFLSGYAILMYENEKLKDCIETVDKIEAIAGSSMDANLYFIRGLSKLNLHKRADAVVDLEHAYKHGFADLPDTGIIGVREPAEIYERLGYLYRDLGRKSEARDMLRKFIEKSEVLSDNARKDIQGDIDKI